MEAARKGGAPAWYSERVDDEDGAIHYEAHGPKESYVRFDGTNAKVDCERFITALGWRLIETAPPTGDVILLNADRSLALCMDVAAWHESRSCPQHLQFQAMHWMPFFLPATEQM